MATATVDYLKRLLAPGGTPSYVNVPTDGYGGAGNGTDTPPPPAPSTSPPPPSLSDTTKSKPISKPKPKPKTGSGGGGGGGRNSLKQKALDILKKQHEQNLADIKTGLANDIKSMIRDHQNAVARTGMSWSSIAGSLDQEQGANLRMDAARSRNLENINYSQGILSILQKYAGSGGSRKPATQPTQLPTRGGATTPTRVTDATSGGSSPSLNQAVRNGTVPWQAAQAYTGARGSTNTRRTQRQIMDERLGLA